jgi:hypothetical protein
MWSGVKVPRTNLNTIIIVSYINMDSLFKFFKFNSFNITFKKFLISFYELIFKSLYYQLFTRLFENSSNINRQNSFGIPKFSNISRIYFDISENVDLLEITICNTSIAFSSIDKSAFYIEISLSPIDNSIISFIASIRAEVSSLLTALTNLIPP